MTDYTTANAIKKITTGDEAGTWGASTNNNFDIIDRASNGYSNALNIQGLTGSGTASAPYELPQSTTAVLSDGHYKVIRFTSAGSLSSSTYLRLARDDKARMYMFVNATTGSQSLIIGQATGSLSGTTNATIANGKAAIVLADGAGSTSSTVVDFSALIGGIAELDVTAGTVTASKAVVVDSDKDITGFRNITLTGELDAATLDISGNADIDGTLEADAITVNGTALSSVIAGTTVTNATQLANARTIGGVSFNGTANIDLPGVNTAGNQNTSGNAASATTAAALTGDATRSGDFTVDASADIVLDADGNGGISNFKFKNGSGGGTFNMAFDNSENMVITGAQSFRLSTGGDINLDADGGQIFLRQGNTQRGFIDVQNTSTLDFHAGSSGTEALKITTSGVNVVQGLRVGDTTAPTDNDLHVVGDITCGGALSKGSGSFQIPHPLPSKTNTHYLVHSFLEGPQADLIYRGKVALTGGSATVNIDTAAGMSEGTFALLCRDVQCFTSNETGWTAIKGSVSGNTLTITAQDNSCTDTISWMVVGERKDQHMINTDWTDETGKVIVEPKKVVEE